MSILQLVDKGELTLLTRAVDVLNLGNSRIAPEVTVYHLLTMTSVIADWFDESGDLEMEW